MYTFGFNFRPWENDSAIAERDKIIDYLQATVKENAIDERIEYGVHIKKASWSSDANLWTLETEGGDVFSCHYIYMCAGYYNYDQAYEPVFEGVDGFQGEVLHPQFWPDDAQFEESSMVVYWFCKTWPNYAKKKLIGEIEKELGDSFDAKHFTPNYDPWDQRVCLCPDSDLFQSIKADKASIETDHIERFYDNGIELKSGKRLEADVVVTATGLKMQFFGGIEFIIDGQEYVANESYVYKGMMLSGVPNLFLAAGYTNASWTLKVDLTHRYASRVIQYMADRGYSKAVATIPEELYETPLMDLSAGYIQRSLSMLPKQAVNKPWRLNQNFILDSIALRFTSVDDDEMKFS